MAVETLSRVGSSGSALGGKTEPLFSFEASREGKVVARLYGLESEDHIRVAAEIYPATVLKSSEPKELFHDFPTRELARQFVDDGLIALEYLGCIVTDLGRNAEAVTPWPPAG